PDKSHAGMAVTIAVAPEAPAEAAEQEYDQDNDEYRSKRHGTLPVTRRPAWNLAASGSKAYSGPGVVGGANVATSFRGDAKHRTRNLEIPGSRYARPGMTFGHFFVSSIGSTLS